jgi:hypothetical protein
VWRRRIGLALVATTGTVSLAWAATTTVSDVTITVAPNCLTATASPDPAYVEGLSVVRWTIDNTKCPKASKVQVEKFWNLETDKAEDPTHKNCKRYDTPAANKVGYVVCSVTKTPAKDTRYKYDLKVGEVTVDPQLIVRKPSSLSLEQLEVILGMTLEQLLEKLHELLE